MKITRTNIKWVAQVSILRPGCCGQDRLRGNTQVSEARPGPPTYCFEATLVRLVALFCGGEFEHRDLVIGFSGL
jgi:hypothetical protein